VMHFYACNDDRQVQKREKASTYCAITRYTSGKGHLPLDRGAMQPKGIIVTIRTGGEELLYKLNSAIERGTKPDAWGWKPCHWTNTLKAAVVNARVVYLYPAGNAVASKSGKIRDCSKDTRCIQPVHDGVRRGFVDRLRLWLHATYPVP